MRRADRIPAGVRAGQRRVTLFVFLCSMSSVAHAQVGVGPPVTSVEEPTTTTTSTTTTTLATVAPTTTFDPAAPTLGFPTSTVPATTVAIGPVTSSSAPSSSTALSATASSTAASTTSPLASTTIPTDGLGNPLPVVAGSTLPTVVPGVPIAPESTSSPLSPPVGATSTTKPTPTTIPVARTPEELRVRIERVMTASPGIGYQVSIDGIGVVAAREADVGRIPASTQKLYPAGTALLTMDPETRFVTEVRSSAIVNSNGVIHGDLVIKGSGDPSLTTSALAGLAAKVAQAGVKSINGDLVADESRYDALRTNAGWKAKFTPGEVGVLSAFAVDGNRRGAATKDPAVANLAIFRAALKQRGVFVVGRDRTGVLPAGGPTLGSVTSAPLRELVAIALKKSDNTYAELFLKELGARSGTGSAANGLAVISQQFERFGLRPPIMADGSGLSSINRSTPAQQVAWLARLRSSAAGSTFRDALPASCVDGTMKKRLCQASAARRVFAKTGTLDNVTALAGYATTASGRTVTFSFLANVASTSRARSAIDSAVVAIAESRL